MIDKIVSIKSNAIFLAAILVLGTLATIFPSFMVGTAQAEPYYGVMDKTYKKSDKKDVSVKSIKCNNINVNVNGLELNVLPPALANLLSSGDEGERGAASYGSGSGGQSGYDKNTFKFVCINNNNNTVVGGGEEEPEVPEPITCEECFTENIIEEVQITNFTGTLAGTEFGDLEGLCEFLLDPTFTNDEKIAQLSLIFSRTNIPTEVRLSILECLDERGIIIVPSDFEFPPEP